MPQFFFVFVPHQALLCHFPGLPQLRENNTHENQALRGGTAQLSPLLQTAALKWQVDCLTSQRDEALQMLQQLGDFSNAIYPAYKGLSLQELKDKLNLREDCSSQLHNFHQTALKLLSDLETKQETISELASEVLRLGDTRLEANHDDYYFATKFAGVFRAVEEWVYLRFVDADIEQQLEGEAVDLFRERAGGHWPRWLKEEHLVLLTSVVTELLVIQVLEPPLLGMADSCVSLVTPAIEKSFIENTDADIRWRSRTIEILSDSTIFWEAFEPTAYNLFDKILKTFSLLDYKNTSIRTKKLAALIKEGGSVAIEYQREPSLFKFKRFPPGSRCKAKMVTDARNRVKDGVLEMEEGKWVVAMTVAPAVLRVSYGSGKVVVVVKARVVLVERAQESDGEGGISEEGRSSEEGGSSKEESEDTDEEEEGSREEGSSEELEEGSSEELEEGSSDDLEEGSSSDETGSNSGLA